MKQIKLTENELRAKIAECVTSALQGFNEEIEGAADIAGMENDEEEGFNPEWAIEDVCESFGQGPVKIEGVLGRWDGKHTIQPISMPDIETAIYSCIEKSDGEIMGEDDILYYPEKELVVLNVHHHDGTNVFQITPSVGEEELYEMKKVVEKLVRESFDSINMAGMMPQQYDYNQQEANKSNKTKEHVADNEKRSGKSIKGKRALVLNWLKDPSVNCAEIMRKLWNPSSEEEDAARSYFYKCRDGKLNDSGVPYKFSDSDINSLYKIKSEKSA